MSKLSFTELLAKKKAELAASSTKPAIEPALPVDESATKPANAFLAKLAAAKSEPKPEPTPEPALEEEVALPKIVISEEVVKLSNAVVVSEEALSGAEESSTVEAIKERIARLASLSDLDLKLAMDGLKALILSNPSACAQLLPEDVGEMVGALRRMTGNAKAAALAAPARRRAAKTKAVSVDPDELSALLDAFT